MIRTVSIVSSSSRFVFIGFNIPKDIFDHDTTPNNHTFATSQSYSILQASTTEK